MSVLTVGGRLLDVIKTSKTSLLTSEIDSVIQTTFDWSQWSLKDQSVSVTLYPMKMVVGPKKGEKKTKGTKK